MEDSPAVVVVPDWTYEELEWVLAHSPTVPLDFPASLPFDSLGIMPLDCNVELFPSPIKFTFPA
jgi:hypothetical protein